MRLQVSTDTLFRAFCWGCAGLGGVLLVTLIVQLAQASQDIWGTFGLGFLWGDEWNPVLNKFGAWPAIVGTVLTTCIALLIALPLAFVSALFLVDAPPWLGKPLEHAVDLLAAIPSVIYGMWGLFVLVPIMQSVGLHFNEFAMGFGVLTSGLILALMVLPYICAVMRDVFRMTPSMLRESAFGAGCTRWEVARDIVLRYGVRGLLGGVFIGLGRALGETMAVLFVCGNMMMVPESLWDGCTTIAATLANNFAEADGMERSALFALGLVLLLMALALQCLAQWYLSRTRKQRGETA